MFDLQPRLLRIVTLWSLRNVEVKGRTAIRIAARQKNACFDTIAKSGCQAAKWMTFWRTLLWTLSETDAVRNGAVSSFPVVWWLVWRTLFFCTFPISVMTAEQRAPERDSVHQIPLMMFYHLTPRYTPSVMAVPSWCSVPLMMFYPPTPR